MSWAIWWRIGRLALLNYLRTTRRSTARSLENLIHTDRASNIEHSQQSLWTRYRICKLVPIYYKKYKTRSCKLLYRARGNWKASTMLNWSRMCGASQIGIDQCLPFNSFGVILRYPGESLWIFSSRVVILIMNSGHFLDLSQFLASRTQERLLGFLCFRKQSTHNAFVSIKQSVELSFSSVYK